MEIWNLPDVLFIKIVEMIVFEEMFLESAGNPIIYQNKELILLDRIKLSTQKTELTLEFIEKNSDWRQGLALKTDGTFFVADQKIKNKIILWYDTAPKVSEMSMVSKSKELILYNIWDEGNGSIEAWRIGAAMHVTVTNDSRTYYCNDGYPDDDLNDVIFQLRIK